MSGRKIYFEKLDVQEGDFQKQIPTANFPAGKYVLTIFSKNQPIVTSPFIVESK